MGGLTPQAPIPRLMLRFILSLLSAVVFLGAPLLGQETEIAKTPAQEIAAGIAGLKDKSFEFDLSLKAKGGDGDEGGDTSASGHIAWAGLRNFSIEISATVMSDLGEEEQSFRIVADGTDIYMETGEEGIIKVNIDALEELQPQLMGQLSEQGLELGASSDKEGSASFEEVLLAALSDVTIKALPSPAGVADRRFVFSASTEILEEAGEALTPDTAEELAAGLPEITVAFGKDCWIPTLLEVVVGEENMLQMSHTNIRLTEAFAEGAFVYSPPEGAVVQDMTPMLQMMAAQMVGQPDDEDELEF